MTSIVTAPARHLPSTVDPRVRDSIIRALYDVLVVVEHPPGSNRGPAIDAYNIRAGAPVGSYWCASAAGAYRLDAGLEMPAGYASCENIRQWAIKTGRWSKTPDYGAFVLYGHDVAHHIGMVVGLDILRSVEGNTTIEGAAYGSSRNGVAVSGKEITASDPVLGYCLPFPIVGAHVSIPGSA